MLQTWFLFFSTCNVQTYKNQSLVISGRNNKELAFGKLFIYFLLPSVNQNFSHLIN